jgi:sporulation protein YlmC with PRC-barrel domain
LEVKSGKQERDLLRRIHMHAEMRNNGGIIGHPEPSPGPGPHILAADTLTGEEVRNEAGESLGKVSHIMLDVTHGTIAYAVLSFGSFLGVGEKLFAVPWSSFALDVDNKWLVLNVDKERLKKAPGFDKDKWPSMANPTWQAEVHGYYGPVRVPLVPFI